MSEMRDSSTEDYTFLDGNKFQWVELFIEGYAKLNGSFTDYDFEDELEGCKKAYSPIFFFEHKLSRLFWNQLSSVSDHLLLRQGRNEAIIIIILWEYWVYLSG